MSINCNRLKSEYDTARAVYDNERNYPPSGMTYNSQEWRANNEKNINAYENAREVWERCKSGASSISPPMSPPAAPINVGGNSIMILVGVGSLSLIAIIIFFLSRR